MLEGMKQTWRELKRAEPGHRFQKYHRGHRSAHRAKWSRPAIMGAGILLIVLGIPAMPAPIIPGFIPIALGAALVARESATVARALDWIELRLREILDVLSTAWKRASAAEKVVAGVSGIAVGGLVTVWLYRMTFG